MVRVLLTGASGTVGSVILAGLLGQPGYTVVTAGRRNPSSPSPSCQHVTLDFADPAATEDVARQLAATGFGAAVFAAGIDSRQGLSCADPDVFRRVMQVNCLAHLQLLRHLARTRDSRCEPFPVVAVSSDVLRTAQPGTAVYAASKAALEEAIRHGAKDVPLRALLMRLPDIGITMAETGEGGITSPHLERRPPPPAAREAAATIVRFLASPDTQPSVQLWP